MPTQPEIFANLVETSYDRHIRLEMYAQRYTPDQISVLNARGIVAAYHGTLTYDDLRYDYDDQIVVLAAIGIATIKHDQDVADESNLMGFVARNVQNMISYSVTVKD